METNAKKSFNRRAFISIAMFSSGIFLPLSGYMNHLFQFETITGERHIWMSVHNVSAVLFTIFAIFHVVANWRSMVRYFQKVKGRVVSRESFYAILFVVVIVGFISSHAFIAG